MSSSRWLFCHAWLMLVLVGCTDESRDESLSSGGAGGTGAGKSEQGGFGGAAGSPPPAGTGGTGGRGGSAGANPTMDAGAPEASDAPHDAGPSRGDARVDTGSPDDAGWIFGPSCCKTHEEPGCKHAPLEKRVCDALPSCCEEARGSRENAWDEACVLYVEHQYYDPSVRDCVCDADQAGQSECCDVQWTNTCSRIAESFCDAPWTC